MNDSNTFVNALVGAVLTGILAWIVPLAPIVGGAATAYLQRADTNEGVRTGALSGAIALVPVALLGAGVVAVVGVFTLDPIGISASIVGVGFLLALGALYVVGLSALGGYLGGYLAVRYGRRRTETRI